MSDVWNQCPNLYYLPMLPVAIFAINTNSVENTKSVWVTMIINDKCTEKLHIIQRDLPIYVTYKIIYSAIYMLFILFTLCCQRKYIKIQAQTHTHI